MPRNPDLDKLLREVDDLTSGSQYESAEEVVPESVDPQTATPSGGSSFLKSIGGFFISKVEEEPEYQDVPPPSPNTVSEMAESEPLPEFETTADDMSTKKFADIYAEAGVDESAFTVDKLNELLQDATLKDQPMSTKALVVKMALKAQNVTPDVPVNDAVKRDRALDAYQKMLNDRAAQTEAGNSQAIQQINEEVKKYLEQKNAEMDALRTETAEMKRQSEAFAARRVAEEQRLAEIVVPLLEGQPNPVTTGNK
ncbi:MAG TPA: hypothetical protein PKY59_02060 [Pyrinomonadaceae bacterium]|nr:hypothetical protein [Pyrinomonadaceae bacterium]